MPFQVKRSEIRTKSAFNATPNRASLIRFKTSLPANVPRSPTRIKAVVTASDIEEVALEAHISRLRKRLKPHGISIKVKRGLGYTIQLSAPI